MKLFSETTKWFGSVKDVMLLIGDWLCQVPLGLLRLRLVMTLRLVFARFGTNRSNLLWVQVVHLSITCDRLPMVFKSFLSNHLFRPSRLSATTLFYPEFY
jgi:hypothetical protein